MTERTCLEAIDRKVTRKYPWVSYFPHCCHKIHDQSNLREKTFTLVFGSRESPGWWGSVVAGTACCWYHCIHAGAQFIFSLLVQHSSSQTVLSTVKMSLLSSTNLLGNPSQTLPEACLHGDCWSCQVGSIIHHKPVCIRSNYPQSTFLSSCIDSGFTPPHPTLPASRPQSQSPQVSHWIPSNCHKIHPWNRPQQYWLSHHPQSHSKPPTLY